VGLVTFEENVWDPKAQAGEDEVEQGTTQGLTVLGESKIIVTDILGERLVGAEVQLAPVCYPGRYE
jgi:hypothetical protein